jgi:hypothetical protein
MAEDRVKKRHPKRFALKFGFDKAEKLGFTNDINHQGLFIRSAVVMQPGLKIRVEISHPDGPIALLGKVQWAKKVPAYVIHKMKGGMGVEITSFLSGEELYRSLCNELDKQRGE